MSGLLVDAILGYSFVTLLASPTIYSALRKKDYGTALLAAC